MLFRALRRKTRFRIVMPLLLSLFLACLTILTVASRSYFRIYEENAENYVETKENAAGLFLNLIEEASLQYSFDKTNPILRLDMLKQSNKNILAAIHFQNPDTLYISSDTKGFPDYNTLLSLPEIRSFLQGNESTRWFIRNEQIAEYYHNKKYDSKSGVLTYLRKESNGVLMLDVQTSALFSILESQNADSGGAVLQNGNITVCSDSDRILTKDEQATIQKLLSNNSASADLHSKSARVYRIGIANSLFATIEISYRYVRGQILTLALVIFSLFLLFSGLTLLIAALLTNSIIRPLEELHKKMQNEKLDAIPDTEPEPEP